MVLQKLNLSRSTYYYNLSHSRNDTWQDIRPLIHEAFARTANGMGYRQIALVLRNEHGLSLSGKTVLKLMREEQLCCKIRKKRYNSYSGEVGKVAENILNRNFYASRPRQKLVTDVTEFNVAGSKAYLSPVMDLYNNEIISWEVSRSQTLPMIHRMLDKLDIEPTRERVVLHSDQGWQYQHRSFQEKLRMKGVQQSMSRKATCLDNACMEGFFGHMKDEFYRNRSFDNFDSFKAELDAYICYWNTRRYQPKLEGLSPEQFRTQSWGAA